MQGAGSLGLEWFDPGLGTPDIWLWGLLGWWAKRR